MRSAALGVVACLAFGSATDGSAQDLKATHKLGETQVGFDLGGSYSNYTLTITGPNGFHASVSSKSEAPSIDLRRVGVFDEGTYHYHLTASTDEKVPVRNALDNGREKEAEVTTKGVSISGVFHVKGSTITKFDPAAREPSDKRQK